MLNLIVSFLIGIMIFGVYAICGVAIAIPLHLLAGLTTDGFWLTVLFGPVVVGLLVSDWVFLRKQNRKTTRCWVLGVVAASPILLNGASHLLFNAGINDLGRYLHTFRFGVWYLVTMAAVVLFFNAIVIALWRTLLNKLRWSKT